MAPSATDAVGVDGTVLTLRKVLTSEAEPLARRFRALFSLKHLACLQPPTEKTVPAIQAIAAAFASRSALLKHELAYCLGQTRNHDSVPYLQQVVKDVEEDAMCRHEAAEALGALGFADSLDILKKLRDDENELDIVRDTCDIAVDRILWENSEEKKAEKLKPRYGYYLRRGKSCIFQSLLIHFLPDTAISPLSIPRRPCRCKPTSPPSQTWKKHCWTQRSLSSKDIVPCSASGTLPHLQTSLPQLTL